MEFLNSSSSFLTLSLIIFNHSEFLIKLKDEENRKIFWGNSEKYFHKCGNILQNFLEIFLESLRTCTKIAKNSAEMLLNFL